MADDIQIHEAANIFPLDEATIPALADDIKTNGQKTKIVRVDGVVVDGRRRLAACKIAGVEPLFEDFTSDQAGDVITLALSLNLFARQLDKSQRAMVAAKAKWLYDQRAKERQTEALARGNKTKHGKEPSIKKDSSESRVGQSRDEAGKSVGVSGWSVDAATKVLAHAVPEIVAAVESGKMSVNKAAKLSDKTADEQRQAIKPPSPAPIPIKDESDADDEQDEDEPDRPERGLAISQEAIATLKKIPINDRFREQGFKDVSRWIKHNL